MSSGWACYRPESNTHQIAPITAMPALLLHHFLQGLWSSNFLTCIRVVAMSYRQPATHCPSYLMLISPMLTEPAITAKVHSALRAPWLRTVLMIMRMYVLLSAIETHVVLITIIPAAAAAAAAADDVDGASGAL